MKVGELCTRTVVVARPHEPVIIGGRRMRDLHVGCLVVVDDRQDGLHPVGIVTDRDLLSALVGEHADGEQRALEDVMTRDLLVARETDDVNDALERMRARGVRRLPVVDRRGVLQGILAFDDLVEWMGEQLADLAKLVSNEQRREQLARP